VWAVVFAAAFLARTAMDWLMPTADFQTRSAVSTLIGAGIFLVTGFWAGSRSGSSIAGAVAALAIAVIALPIQLLGAAMLLAGWHDPLVITAIRSSGGLGEVFSLPLMTIIPGLVFGMIGGMLGAKARGSVDAISSR
jgi:CHASE2 domain-containing sensor protein